MDRYFGRDGTKGSLCRLVASVKNSSHIGRYETDLKPWYNHEINNEALVLEFWVCYGSLTSTSTDLFKKTQPKKKKKNNKKNFEELEKH